MAQTPSTTPIDYFLTECQKVECFVIQIDELETKCEGEKIPFVTEFKLLGVILDEYFSFDMHSIALCNQVNWKTSVLRKSS